MHICTYVPVCIYVLYLLIIIFLYEIPFFLLLTILVITDSIHMNFVFLNEKRYQELYKERILNETKEPDGNIL